MKLGVMTGGGDCPGLNAVIRGVVLAARARGWEVVGIEDATSGLIDLDYRSPHGNRALVENDVIGILPRGGTILGTSNKSDPWNFVVEEGGKKVATDVSARCVENWRKLGLDALVSIGGDGSMRIAQKFGKLGLKIVGVPKTIDQDVASTDTTFGFQTAVQCATEAIDRLQDTAESHDRVMLLELMGRDAGHIALHAALAGAAHACLIPEIPYRIAPVVRKIRERRAQGHPFSIVVVAEGAAPVDGEQSYVSHELGAMPKLLGAAHKVAAALEPALDLDVRVTILGHLQRGGSPVSFDRILGTRYGVAAVEAIEAGKFGQMVALRNDVVTTVPIDEVVAAHQRLVDTGGQLVQAARAVGITFGDD
ncbi:MAG: 6-phosphofructokinase [Planctomycetota bacterium]